MTVTRIALAFGLLLASIGIGAGPAGAEGAKLGDIHIDAPWARASIGPAKAGAAYLTVVNHGSEPDRLLSVETPVARKAALHTHLMDEGVMKMRPVGAIEIDPGAPMVMQPGGLHVMLMGLETPLVEGSSFPLRLIFERAGTVEVMVEVQEPAAMGPGPHQHQHDPSHMDDGGQHQHQDPSS